MKLALLAGLAVWTFGLSMSYAMAGTKKSVEGDMLSGWQDGLRWLFWMLVSAGCTTLFAAEN